MPTLLTTKLGLFSEAIIALVDMSEHWLNTMLSKRCTSAYVSTIFRDFCNSATPAPLYVAVSNWRSCVKSPYDSMYVGSASMERWYVTPWSFAVVAAEALDVAEGIVGSGVGGIGCDGTRQRPLWPCLSRAGHCKRPMT